MGDHIEWTLVVNADDACNAPHAAAARVAAHVGLGDLARHGKARAGADASVERQHSRLSQWCTTRADTLGHVSERAVRTLIDVYRPFVVDLVRMTGDAGFLGWLRL